MLPMPSSGETSRTLLVGAMVYGQSKCPIIGVLKSDGSTVS
jgi:hypothetical protein